MIDSLPFPSRCLQTIVSVLPCLLALLLLSACAIGPNYHRPDVQVPTTFRDTTNGVPSERSELSWWKVFKDPALQDLIRVALTNSYDLGIVLTRVDQARALQSQAESQFMPEVDYMGMASRGRNSFLTLPNYNGGRTLNGFIGGFQAVWEIDLWGRIRRMNEATRAQFMASQESRREVSVSLVSGVACAYFELLELDEQRTIARRTEASYQRTFDLFEEQHANGFTSKLELSRAKAALRAVSARIPEIERQIAVKENEINALLGRNPGSVSRAPTALTQEERVDLPVGLPSTLLERRPDIRLAEQQVRAANAAVGVAIGDFFPRIGLTTFIGSTSTDLNKVLSSSANTWSMAAATLGPVFTAGRLTARSRQARAACEEAKLHYQATALNAFREVSDALVSRTKLEEACALQAEAVAAGQEAVQVSTDRYAAGKASYYEVLEAQQQLFPEEIVLSQFRAHRLLAMIQLYKALGGGWPLAESENVSEKNR